MRTKTINSIFFVGFDGIISRYVVHKSDGGSEYVSADKATAEMKEWWTKNSV